MSAAAGILFIISAPSGAGKSSLVNAVLAQDPALTLSVSHTTRDPRPGEQNGREYHFVAREVFLAMRAAGDFLESAEVHGNFYGTSGAQIESATRAGRDLMLEIDWQGARQIKAAFPAAVSIFILPPSIAELERRLRTRKQDSDAVIARRLAAAAAEISHAPEFEYAIINKDFSIATGELATLVQAARLRTPRQRIHHPELFEPN